MKIALVYDRVNKIGGAERILTSLSEIFPNAPLFTAVYNKETARWADAFRVIPSFLQKLPFSKTKHELYPYAMPFAFETFNFDKYDVVISITSAEAKGIITKPDTLHICYCLTPTRYLWSHYSLYFKSKFFRALSKPIVDRLKVWDIIASKRPDVYIAISKKVKNRIKTYYKQNASIIYPPVNTDLFTIDTNIKRQDFYLVVSRLVSYKRIDIAIDAFNTLQKPLVVVGTGSEESRFKKVAKKNIVFTGYLTDDTLRFYYQSCRGLIFPQYEDFGLTALEAQACGAPVVAYGVAGARESIIEGVTGEFFGKQTKDALMGAIAKFEKNTYSSKKCRENALVFSKSRFKTQFKEVVEDLWHKFEKEKGKL